METLDSRLLADCCSEEQLLKLTRDLTQALPEEGVGLELGDLRIITWAPHIYKSNLERAKEIVSLVNQS